MSFPETLTSEYNNLTHEVLTKETKKYKQGLAVLVIKPLAVNPRTFRQTQKFIARS